MIQAWFFVIMGALMPIQGPKDYGDGEMLSLLKRHEIQVLLKAGFSAKDVAERSGVSLRSVRRVQTASRSTASATSLAAFAPNR